jgi:hypothetical protein
MKKIFLLLICLFYYFNSYSQSIQDTETFLKVYLEKINSFYLVDKVESGKLVKDVSVITHNQIYDGKLIIENIYSKFYKQKYKLKHTTYAQIVDISQIYHIEKMVLSNNICVIRIKSYENCFEFYDLNIKNEIIDNLDPKKSKNNCDSQLMIYNAESDEAITKTIKSLKHLVKLYGGKIIDDLF